MVRAITFVFAAVFAVAVAAQEARDPGIESTIQGQIDAFLVDDFEHALTYASPNIRRKFGTSENFGAMVRNGFPMVWRPADVWFLDLSRAHGFMVQKVMIRDRAGVIHTLEYLMTFVDGRWLINGVQTLDASQVGA